MNCGQRFIVQQAAVAAPMMGQPAPAFPQQSAPSSKKITWIAIGTAFAMILAIFFGLRASGILKFGASDPKLEAMKAEGGTPTPDLLKAEGGEPSQELLKAEGQPPQNNILSVEGTPGPTPIASKAPEKVTMPDDIRKWLEHLERIEKRKNDLTMKQLSQMAVLMQKMKVMGSGMGVLNEDEGGYGGDTGPSETAKDSFDTLRPEWNKLLTDFQSYPPPTECRPIAEDFYRAVSEIPGMNADLADILASIAGNPENAQSALEKVMKIQNTSENVIDKYLGASDEKVGDICRKYETRKWFSIKSDVGGGLMSKFGM